jgi:hypothetical protein
MIAFLSAGVALIKKHDFPSTVGHRFEDDMAELPTGSKRQFHFYPVSLSGGLLPEDIDPVIKDRHLERHSTTRAFLGEIGTSSDHGVSWPDLDGADQGGARFRVRERLNFVKSQGYPLVLLWPDSDGTVFNPGLPGGGPDPIKLSANAQAGVIDFMKLP